MPPADRHLLGAHSPLMLELEPNRRGWRFVPACDCGWEFDRRLPASLCLDEWKRHLVTLDGV